MKPLEDYVRLWNIQVVWKQRLLPKWTQSGKFVNTTKGDQSLQKNAMDITFSSS